MYEEKYFYNGRLKNMIENNSTYEGAFYQSEWVKINTNYSFVVISVL